MGRWFATLVFAAALTFALRVDAREPAVRNGFAVEVPVLPMSVKVHGQQLVSYEIHLTNFSSDRLEISRIAVLDARNGQPVIRLSGDALAAATAVVGGAAAKPGERKFIDPGQRAVVFMDFTVPLGSLKGAIRHEIDYAVVSTGATSTISAGPLSLDRHKPSLIAPPLRGGPWVAIHSAAWPRGHRRVFYAVAGRARLPGRFAIDWVKVDGNGRTTGGDPDIASEAYGYGDDVLAVADASVAAVRDGMDEPLKISQRTAHLPAEDAGNYVTLRLPDGRFAFYEHLRKGSIRVHAGDKVTTGQVLGSLGFSGESTGPHLHFHVADGDSPLDAEGVPFEIRSFRQLGRYDDISKLGSSRAPAQGAAVRENEWPDANAVVDFSAAAR
ncbi:M23 family metallopeptidase [Rhodanobacter sp. Si-c]|uniref:M23 family metallopeptidase n=1 Tax=Rhodanobacter lycopersici TaxID=3162487 RepID=A0ABV3QHM8_9GAMM